MSKSQPMNIMDVWEWAEYTGRRFMLLLLRRVFPVVAVVLAVVIPFTSPQTQGRFYPPFVIFFVCVYGAAILAASDRRNKQPLVEQPEALSTALGYLSDNHKNIDILIYTSYSLFSDFPRHVADFPKLQTARIRLLLHDPDLGRRLSSERLGQLNTAIASVRRHQELGYNIDIRFHLNEPWVRGISVDDIALVYGTYSDKRRTEGALPNEGPEYSGSRTPWLVLDPGAAAGDPRTSSQVRSFIESYKGLFGMIWEECTKYKYLVLDLDGTLFDDPQLASQFESMATDFLRMKMSPVSDESRDAALEIFADYVKKGTSATEAVLKALKECGNRTPLDEYLQFKDSRMETLALSNLKRDKELRASLLRAQETNFLYMLTNHTSAFAEVALEKLGVADLFPKERVITISDMDCAKPSPQALQTLRDRGVELGRAIFIGDRQSVDLDYAEAEALATVLVSSPAQTRHILNQLRFPVVSLVGTDHLQGCRVRLNASREVR